MAEEQDESQRGKAHNEIAGAISEENNEEAAAATETTKEDTAEKIHLIKIKPFYQSNKIQNSILLP